MKLTTVTCPECGKPVVTNGSAKKGYSYHYDCYRRYMRREQRRADEMKRMRWSYTCHHCGKHVVGETLVYKDDFENLHFFCCKKCREEWLKERQKKKE